MTAVSSGRVHMTLTSNPHKRRAGLLPLCAFLLMFWVMDIGYFIVSIGILDREPGFALSLMASMLGFAVILGLITVGLLRDAYRDYILELTESEAVLVVIDRLRKKKGTNMVLLDDITYAEYYPYSDQAAVILHTSYTNMEVPLWPLPNSGRDVVDFLEGRGVIVVNVQSDEAIPE